MMIVWHEVKKSVVTHHCHDFASNFEVVESSFFLLITKHMRINPVWELTSTGSLIYSVVS